LGSSNVLQSLDNLPSMVGGSGLKNLPKPSMTGDVIYDNQVTRLPSNSNSNYNYNNKSIVIDVVAPKVIQKDFIGTGKTSHSNTIQIEEPKYIQPDKVIQDIVPNQKDRQNFIQKPTQVNKQKQNGNTIYQIYNPESPNPPKKKTIIQLPVLNDSNRKSSSFMNEDLGSYKVYGRRKGKFNELGSSKSELEAEKIAKEFSLGTLGASTMIEQNGKSIEFNLGSGFRKSKSNKFINVQERGNRLSSWGERSEIKRSKRRR